MKKYILAGCCSALILFMIPIVVVGAVVSNPLGFLGELIFGSGNNTSNSNETITLYQMFLESDIGTEISNYLHEKEKDGNVSDADILLPLILSFQDNDLSKLNEYTLESLDAKEKIDILYELRIANSNDTEYISALKDKDEFQILNNFSDSTIISYIEIINNTVHKNDPSSSEIDVDSDLYQKNNPFIPTYRGQCTWFAYCRALEVTGSIMPTGNARDWLELTDLPTGNKPKTHAVAVFAGEGSLQHVIFIENYENGMITFSEGNYDNPCYNGSCNMVDYASDHYKELINVQTMPYSAFLIQRETNMELLGFIYTEEK